MRFIHKERTTLPRANFQTNLLQNVWLFPAIIVILLILLTCLRVSGSSIGAYYPILFKGSDPNLIVNHPQSIRSDEWLVNTQLTIAQKAAGFPLINTNINTGRNMSIVGDVPYKEWSTLFKPQNLAFFFLPLEYAFAFKWWLLLALTIISVYFFVLRFFPNRYLLAAFISTGFGLSPYFFWWYSTGTLAPVFYGFFIALTAMRIINKEPIPLLKSRSYMVTNFIYIIALAYLLTAFALILYPPFQISVALVVTFFLLGYFIDKRQSTLFSRESYSRLGILMLSVLLAGLIVLTFYSTRSSAISTVTNTVYPGKRIVAGGGTPAYEIFSTYLQPQLQRKSRAENHYYSNQSESSNFILLLPFLLIPGFIVLFAEYKKFKSINCSLLMVQLCAVLLLMNLFFTSAQPIYKIFLLDKVPHERLFMGLGLLGIIQLLLIAQSIKRLKMPQARISRLTAIYVLICLLPLLVAGQYTRVHYPLFIHSILLISFFCTIFALILFCFLSNRLLLGAAFFLIFSIGSVFHIQPLYRGLGPLYHSEISEQIDAISKPKDTWATADDLLIENFALMANRDSMSGIQPYPDINLWRQVAGSKDDFIYNRYAHVLFNSDPAFTSKLELIQFDSFQVQLACSNFVKRHIQFVLSTRLIDSQCTRKVKELIYPSITFYIYKIH